MSDFKKIDEWLKDVMPVKEKPKEQEPLNLQDYLEQEQKQNYLRYYDENSMIPLTPISYDQLRNMKKIDPKPVKIKSKDPYYVINEDKWVSDELTYQQELQKQQMIQHLINISYSKHLLDYKLDPPKTTIKDSLLKALKQIASKKYE